MKDCSELFYDKVNSTLKISGNVKIDDKNHSGVIVQNSYNFSDFEEGLLHNLPF